MDKIIQQMRQFHQSPTTEKLRELLRQRSLLDIWGVGRKENGHSNFLAWLLNPEESHGLGNFALQKLLLLLASFRLSSEQQLPESLQHAILAGKNIIRSAKVEREAPIPDGRLDILTSIELTQELEGIKRLQIVIENKIDASERKGQTNRYYEYFSTKDEEGTKTIYVYLSPMQASPCKDVHFIHIYYQHVLDSLLTPALKLYNISEYTRFLLEEYIRHLSFFDSESTFIAMNEHHRGLLIKFWEENSPLIGACAQAISEDPDVSPEVQESARNIVKQIKKVDKRDRSKYICKNPNGNCTMPLGKGRMVLHVVRSHFEEQNCTYEQLQKDFFPNLFEEYKNIDKPTRMKRYFTKANELIVLETGEVIAVSNQCGKGKQVVNFDDFIKKAKNLGFVITKQENQ